MEKLFFSPSPHINNSVDTRKIMLDVIIALMPAFIASIIFFGLQALIVTTTAVVSCVLTEYIFQKLILKMDVRIGDLSAVVTGILLAYNLPSSIPLWMVVLGSIAAIGMAKMVFGGLGQNSFNPALVGRVFLLVSFPVAMTTWPVPQNLDGTTAATALSLFKEGIKQGHSLPDILSQLPSVHQLFTGFRGGCLGETSIIAILLGGIYLLFRRVISWHIPVSYIFFAWLFAAILWLAYPGKFLLPSYHILTGGLMLGAWFMATDMVTTPMTKKGMIIFGAGCGIITILIRSFGAYPEGTSFAILIMNAFTPLMNKYLKPVRFGEVPQKA